MDFLLGVMKCSKRDCGENCTTFRILKATELYPLFKWVNCISCELHTSINLFFLKVIAFIDPLEETLKKSQTFKEKKLHNQ